MGHGHRGIRHWRYLDPLTRTLGGVILAALVALAYQKYTAAVLPEMLWACHLASALVALGLFTLRPLPVAVGTLLHLCVGLPVWLLDVLVVGVTTAQSFVLHLLTPAAGLFFLISRRPALPRQIAPLAFALAATAAALSRLFTPAELNVNLAHDIYSPVAHVFPSFWFYQLANYALLAGLLFLGAQALDRTLGDDDA